MFKGILIFLAYCITTIYCSSQNHVSSDLLLLILSAADPSCMLKEQCGPKMNSNNKPYAIFINDSNNPSVQPLSATIYDIIPELRTRTEEDAKEYFTKVLFPSAKKAFNEYFGVSNFNELNLSQQDLEVKLVDFQNHLNDKAEMEDIVKGLISSNNENIGYLDDSKDRTLHNFYNDVSNKFSRYVRLNPYNGHGTFYNNNNNNNPIISENLLNAMVMECKERDTCLRHFKDGNSNIAILEHINANNEKEYHLIINDKKNERTIHPFTFTEIINNNGQIAYELNHNYYHKEIHYYKNINMDGIKNTVIQNNGGNFNTIHDIFANKLINRARNTNGNTDNLIGDILNVGNQNSQLFTSSLNNAIKNTIMNKSYFSYDNLSDIVEDTFGNTIDENQKQRLVTYLSKEFSYDIAKKINDHFNNSHNGPLTTQIVNNFIKDAIKERCEHEKKLYNNENNISSFDSSLINKALDNPASFTDEEKNNLENMLKDYTKFDNNPNELNEVINILGHNWPDQQHLTLTQNNAKKNLIAARDHKYFKSNLSLINNFEVSFASNDEQERFVQNKLNNFGRTFKEPLSNSNRGYYKDSEYDLGIKSGITYTDNSASTNKALYIPQENELDIGDRASFNVAPYSYKDQNVGKTKDKMNNNGIQKYIYNESNSPVKLSNLINAITNNQVNTKLSEHLRSINNILKNDQDYLKPNDNKFTNPNHWRDDIIIQNLNNIFEQSYNDFENLDNLCNELEDYINQESNSGSNSFSLTEISNLANKIANNYCIQQNLYPNENKIKNGENFGNTDQQYSNIVGNIQTMLLNKDQHINELNGIKEKLEKEKNNALKVSNEANNLLNQIDGTSFTVTDQAYFIKHSKKYKSFDHLTDGITKSSETYNKLTRYVKDISQGITITEERRDELAKEIANNFITQQKYCSNNAKIKNSQNLDESDQDYKNLVNEINKNLNLNNEETINKVKEYKKVLKNGSSSMYKMLDLANEKSNKIDGTNYSVSDRLNRFSQDKIFKENDKINNEVTKTYNDMTTYVKEVTKGKSRLTIESNELAKEVANNFIIQQRYCPDNVKVKYGQKLDESDSDYENLVNEIQRKFDFIDEENKAEINNYVKILNEERVRTRDKRNEANNLLNQIDGTNISINDRRNNYNNNVDPYNNNFNFNIDDDFKSKEFKKIKEKYDNKNLGVNINGSVLCQYSNNNLIPINKVSNNVIEKHYPSNNNNNNIFEEIGLKMLHAVNIKKIAQGIFTFNTAGTTNGVGVNELNHHNNVNENLNTQKTIDGKLNIATQCNSDFNSRKRELGGSCKYVPKVNNNVNIDDFTIETLKSFKEKGIDSKILSQYNNVEDISNVKNLHENAETIDNVWKELTDTYYKYIHKFSESESETFLANFNIVLNEYKNRVSNSEYNNDPHIQNISPEMISKMETDLTRAYNYHYEHFDPINDEDSPKISNRSYNTDSQSKMYREKFIHTLNNIVNIIAQHEGNPISGLGTMYNGDKISSEINPNSIVPNTAGLKDAIEKLIQKIPSLDESYNNQLIKIYDNLSELYSINDMEYGLNQKTSVNSEIIHKLYDALSDKMGMENSLKENVKPSENTLKVPGLERVENNNVMNTIKDNSISTDDKNMILKGMEHEINNSPNKYLENQLYKTMNNIHTHINNLIEQLNKFTSPLGHMLEIANIVSLSAAYNDLAATAIYNNKIYNNNMDNSPPINTLEFNNEFNNRVNYVINIQFNNAMVDIAKNNPSRYNVDIKINSGNKFSWSGNTVYEPSNKILSQFINDGSPFNSRSEFNSKLIQNADGSSYRTLQQSYQLKYNYVNYQSPASRDQNHINDIEHNYGKLGFKHIQKNIQSIDIYHSTQFFTALTAISTYNPNLTPLSTKDDNKNIVSIKTMYKGASNYKEMFTEMNKFENDLKNNNKLTNEIKLQINDAANKFTVDIQVTSYKLAKMAGRENQNTFTTFTNEFNSVANGVSGYLKNNAHLYNNERSVPQFKYNQNTLNVVHNHNLNNHNINKNNKELRISSSKVNKHIGGTKKT